MSKWINIKRKIFCEPFHTSSKKIRFSRIILEVVDWNPFWSPWAIFPHNPVLHYADTSWKNKTGENDGISLRLRLCLRIVWDYQKIFPLLDLTVVIDSFPLSDILAGDVRLHDDCVCLWPNLSRIPEKWHFKAFSLNRIITTTFIFVVSQNANNQICIKNAWNDFAINLWNVRPEPKSAVN